MKTLLKNDALYWSGKPTGMTDAEFSAASKTAGHVSQPRGWKQYQKRELIYPAYGLDKLYSISGLHAACHYPKWDGIYLQSVNNRWITRGDGRTGLDITDWITRHRAAILCREIVRYSGTGWSAELCLPYPFGRQDLVRALASGGEPPLPPLIIPHLAGIRPGNCPQHVPAQWVAHGFSVDIDGWVLELFGGEKLAYKVK